MNLKALKEYTRDLMDKYPGKREELVELYLLAQAEIEGGEPELSECEKAYDDMVEICGGKNE